MTDSKLPGEGQGPGETGQRESVLVAHPPGSSPAISPPSLQTPIGAHLEPVLREVCSRRLGPISWFRTDWQRGGAATGYALWQDETGSHETVVKLPVPPCERHWLKHLQDGGVAPRLFAHGEELGSYDLAWLVMERLGYGPLGSTWEGAEFDLLVEATGRFYAAARHLPLGEPAQEKDWEKILQRSRDRLQGHALNHEQRWKVALKSANYNLKEWLKLWQSVPHDHWCHGDLHLGNAMSRQPAPQGPAVLLDYACVHRGHWVEDAIYLEHLYWSRRQRLGGRRLCSMLAKERKKHGLTVESGWPQLAAVRRALLAMSTPAMLEHDGDPHHVDAALEVLEMETK